jgi:hypothetical protein
MENKVNKSMVGNRIFYIILILLILGSVGVTFYKIVWQKDYQIEAETSCDPVIESCFHYEGVICDSGDTECVPEEAYDYKMISKSATNIYACEQTDEKLGCDEELSCTDEEVDCSYTFCDPESLGDGESCSETPVEEISPESAANIGSTETITEE